MMTRMDGWTALSFKGQLASNALNMSVCHGDCNFIAILLFSGFRPEQKHRKHEPLRT